MAQESLQYLISIIFDKAQAKEAQKDIGMIGQAAQKAGINIQQGFGKSTQSITQSTTSISKQGKMFKQHSVTVRDVHGGYKKLNFVTEEFQGKMKLVDNSIKATNTTTKAHGKSIGGLIGGYAKLALRAVAVVPIWMLLRSIYMGLIKLVTGSIKAWLDLERELGRVATVTRGTSKDIDNMRESVIEFGRTSSRSFKEAAQSLYALGSAGLSVQEQMAGMTHVMNLAIGSFGDVEQVAKLVAGAYNVFGDSMEGAYTSSAKFKKISDILAFTYSNQQVELSEIANAMTFVASVGNLVNVSFEQLVGTIGVLNTGMLKGTKAGTSLLNALAQIAQQPEKLSNLGISFDPSKPMDFLDIITQLNEKYGESALSVQSLREIMETFGRRGGRAIAQLISDFDRWTSSLENANKNFNNFAEEMREKAENTLPMAFRELGNEIQASLIDKFKLAGDALKEYAQSISKTQKELRGVRNLGDLLAEGSTIRQTRAVGPMATTSKVLSEKGKLNLEVLGQYAETLIAIRNSTEKEKKLKIEMVTLDEYVNQLAKRRNEGLLTEDEALQRIHDFLNKILNFEKFRGNELGELLTVLRKELRIKEDIVQSEGKLSKAQNKKIRSIESSFRFQMLTVNGIKDSVMAQVKLNQLVKNFQEDHKVTLDIQKLLNGNFSELENAMVHVLDGEKDALAIRKQSLALVQEISKETQKYSDDLKSTFEDALSDVFAGESTFMESFNKINEKIKRGFSDALSKGVTEKIFDMTGIGTIFGEFGVDLENIFKSSEERMKDAEIEGHKIGGKSVKRDIIEGHVEGGRIAAEQLGIELEKISVTPSGGGGVSMGGISNMMGVQGFLQKPMWGGQGKGDPRIGMTAATKPGPTFGQGLMAIQGAQSLANMHKLKGTGDIFGGGMQGAMAGAQVGQIAGPVGAVVGAIIGAGFGMFKAGQVKIQEETKEQSLRITSRIDVTNKRLEIVNRNLVALRTDLAYILPRSAYFSEKLNLEDEFSLHNRRGLI